MRLIFIGYQRVGMPFAEDGLKVDDTIIYFITKLLNVRKAYKKLYLE